MRVCTHLGTMSDRRREKISIAIVGVLTQSSKLEDATAHHLGLLALDGFNDASVQWIVERLTKGKRTLSSGNITERLPEKYKLHPQQITKLVKRMERTKDFPVPLVTIQVKSRKEFSLDAPPVKQRQLFGI